MKDYCTECLKKRTLHKNRKCRRCNRKFGLKECSRCHELKLVALDFYHNGSDGVCKYCLGYSGRGGGRYLAMPEDVRAAVIQLFQEGHKKSHIAKAVGYSRAMISKVLKPKL